MIGIYKLTNKINGKVYIGQSRNIKNRWRGHKFESKIEDNDWYFYNAIRKYGWENFIREILIEITDDTWVEELLNFYEVYFVFYYESMKYTGKGYNVKFPGSNGPMSEDSKKKMRLSQKGHFVSEKTRNKIRIANSGKKQSQETIEKRRSKLIGKKRTEEFKQKYRGSNNGNYGKEIYPNSKKTKCIETQNIYRSAREAGKILNISSKHISECCLGKRKTCNKFHWIHI